MAEKIVRVEMIRSLTLAGGPIYNVGEFVGLPEHLATECLEGGLAKLDTRPVPKPKAEPSGDGAEAEPKGESPKAAKAKGEAFAAPPKDAAIKGAELKGGGG